MKRVTVRTRTATLLVAVAVLGALVACRDDKLDDGQTLPAPKPTTTSTTPIDFTQVSLTPLTGGKGPTTTRPAGPGKASLAGKVLDDSGQPVVGAFVRAAYYVDPEKPEIIEALTGPDGGYRFDQLFGGPWRVRAWLTPMLATLEPVSVFLGAAEQKVIDLKVKAVDDVALTAKMAPDVPLLGWAAELAVFVVTQTVDSEGKVDRQPAAGVPVTLTNGSSWSIQTGSNPGTTETDGTVRWTLSCGAEGVQSLTAVAFGREFPLTLPSCLSPASTTTTTTAPPGSSTSTTKPKKPTTTTSRPKSTSSTRAGAKPQ